jgi:predicted nucleotidyltransferase
MKAISADLLQTATQRLVAEFRPEEIYLFGSHAWGTPSEDSDVDLMVIVPSSDERPIRRMQRAHRCLRGIGFAKDVLVNTRAEFDRYRHLSASLSHKIFQEGRRLYGKAGG